MSAQKKNSSECEAEKISPVHLDTSDSVFVMSQYIIHSVQAERTLMMFHPFS